MRFGPNLRQGGADDAHPGLRVAVAIRDERIIVDIAAPVDRRGRRTPGAQGAGCSTRWASGSP
jgi:hypothetical protein